MELGDRRMCDRCGDEIFQGEMWFVISSTKEELCRPCLHIVKKEMGVGGAYPVYESDHDTLNGQIRVFFGWPVSDSK